VSRIEELGFFSVRNGLPPRGEVVLGAWEKLGACIEMVWTGVGMSGWQIFSQDRKFDVSAPTHWRPLDS